MWLSYVIEQIKKGNLDLIISEGFLIGRNEMKKCFVTMTIIVNSLLDGL